LNNHTLLHAITLYLRIEVWKQYQLINCYIEDSIK